MVYEFGDFRLEERERRLTCRSERLSLAPKAFDTLALLVKSPGRVVSKEEFFASVWSGVAVSEASLKQTILSVRKILNVESEDLLETVPKVGYRFTGTVRRRLAGPPYAGDDRVEPTFPMARALTAPAETLSAESPREPRRWQREHATWVAAGFVALAFAATGWLVGGRSLAARASATGARAVVTRPLQRPAELHALLLRGRFHWDARSGNGLFNSLLSFRQATALYPASAEAWCGVAAASAFDIARWGEADEAARKALELDPSLAEAHAVRAFVAMAWRWDLDTARRELGTARRLAPRDPLTGQWSALRLALEGRLSEAQVEIDELAAENPVLRSALADRAELLYLRGDSEAAKKAVAEVMTLDPHFPPALDIRYRIALAAGQLDEAAAVARAYSRAAGDVFTTAEPEGQSPARYLASTLPSLSGLPAARAVRLMALSRPGDALDALEQGLEERAFLLPLALADPIFEPLRPEPRWKRLEQRIRKAQADAEKAGVPLQASSRP